MLRGVAYKVDILGLNANLILQLCESN